MGTQLAFAWRRTEATERFIDQVLSQPNLTTLEKAPVYITKIGKLTTSDMSQEDAVQTCFAALHDLGLSPGSMLTLPVRFSCDFFDYSTDKGDAKREIQYPASPQRPSSDEAIMTILFRLSYAAYMVKTNVVVMWATNQMVEITLQRGVTTVSCVAFSTLGMLAAVAKKDYEAATFFFGHGPPFAENCTIQVQ